MSEVKVVGKTKAGKEIGYHVPDGSNLYEVAFKQGGEVPGILRGRWNDLRQLTMTIQGYIESSSPKPKRS